MAKRLHEAEEAMVAAYMKFMYAVIAARKQLLLDWVKAQEVFHPADVLRAEFIDANLMARMYQTTDLEPPGYAKYPFLREQLNNPRCLLIGGGLEGHWVEENNIPKNQFLYVYDILDDGVQPDWRLFDVVIIVDCQFLREERNWPSSWNFFHNVFEKLVAKDDRHLTGIDFITMH